MVHLDREPQKFEDFVYRIVCLQMFRPKNWSRVKPITWIFVLSLILLIIGMLGFARLKFLALASSLILIIMLAGPIVILWNKIK